MHEDGVGYQLIFYIKKTDRQAGSWKEEKQEEKKGRKKEGRKKKEKGSFFFIFKWKIFF